MVLTPRTRSSSTGSAIALALAALLSLQSTTVASTAPIALQATSLVDLSRGADTIIVGSIAAKQSRWEGKRIVTEYQVNVQQTLKGDAANTHTIVEPGGRVEQPFPVAMTVEGVPDLQEGHEVVLFLKRNTDGSEFIYALSQGALTISTDEKPRSRFVVRGGHRVQLDAFLHEVEEAVRNTVTPERR